MREYGFWLHFSDEDNERLTPIIRELSERYVEGKLFLPHVSIFKAVEMEMELEEVREKVDRCCGGVTPFRVRVTGLGYGERWSRTLYMQFAQHPTLSKISECFQEQFKEFGEYHFDPHASLMYKEGLDEGIKKRLVREYAERIPKTLTVAGCGVIDPNRTEGHWHAYEKWGVVYERKFG